MIEIPLSVKHDDDAKDTAEVWTKATVDGSELSFILDTGCAMTSLCHSDFSANYNVVERSEYSSAFGKAQRDKILVGKIDCGPISSSNVKIARTHKGGNDKNLLGMDLLKSWCLNLALSETRAELSNERIDKLATQALILDEASIPFIDVQIGSSVAKAVWDTGAGVTIVDQAFYFQNRQLFYGSGSTKGTDSTGASFETEICHMKSVKIGEHLFPEHRVVPLDLSHLGPKTGRGMDFILGYSTLKLAHWVMDFRNKKWAISKVLF